MLVNPIKFQPKVILNNLRKNNVSFKGAEADTFVHETKESNVDKELVEKTRKILEESDIICKEDKITGLLNISDYDSISVNKTLEKYQKHQDITEKDLFKVIQSIEGDACFEASDLKDLGELTYIGGNADFFKSHVESLGKLEHIGGDGIFEYSKIQDLGALETIGGNAYFSNAPIQYLGDNIKHIEGDAYFADSYVKSLGSLKSIGGNAEFENSEIQDLGSLEYVGGNISIGYSFGLRKDDFENMTVGGEIL